MGDMRSIRKELHETFSGLLTDQIDFLQVVANGLQDAVIEGKGAEAALFFSKMLKTRIGVLETRAKKVDDIWGDK